MSKAIFWTFAKFSELLNSANEPPIDKSLWYDSENFQTSSTKRKWVVTLLGDDDSNTLISNINDFIDVSTAGNDEDPNT